MLDRLELADAQLDSPLGRASPIVKLGVAIGWLAGLAFTLAWTPPLALAGAAIAAGLSLGSIRVGALARSIAPLWMAALGIGLFNALFSTSNGDPAAATAVAIGPVRITVEAASNGVALALRVIAIASVGAVFTLTTDPTRLADALVRQAHLSPRFAYGALAAYQAIPRFSEDLATLRQARRIRGLRGSWHPRLLVTLLVLAIRHGDRMALSMDARAFGSGPRTWYRDVRWQAIDLYLAVGAAVVLGVALWVGSTR
ncbi:MAG TPA: energy-coupling factor transporter transmembrane component T [Candidatus Limnocylindrales bacterium]|nr:energy-coupling factor transporter transmembrane component T [Candidatus Limnocylindrales bacterium]